MSIIYLLFIEHAWVGGKFTLGRLADFAHLDILIAIVWWNNWRRWRRLKRIDKGE